MSTIDPPLPTMDVSRYNCVVVIETPAIESDKSTSIDFSIDKDKVKRKVDDLVVSKFHDHSLLFIKD